jgi:hypothetical protein
MARLPTTAATWRSARSSTGITITEGDGDYDSVVVVIAAAAQKKWI